MKALLSGNEAIARGALEAGISFASGYPGTPCTDILEELAGFDSIDAEWSPNEKVALDVAIGMSLGGRRSLVAMKHVGLNVASDTLMTLSYTGVNAGIVIVTADDPGMYSSQNEQDNRNYAKFAKIPLLEPSDSQEAKDFIKTAIDISERFDTPVLVRITTRIAHSKSVVSVKKTVKKDIARKPFKERPNKYAMVPANARIRRIFVEKRLEKLKEYSEKSKSNRIEWGSQRIGIVTSGISYCYAKEALPKTNILKLGMTYPLPSSLIKRFSKRFKSIYVAEELDPFLEEQIAAFGIDVKGKELFPYTNELSPSVISDGILKNRPKKIVPPKPLKNRPMVCAGCFYNGLFYILNKLNLIVMGDIGCYALNVLSPKTRLQTCISMGSGISIASGLYKSIGEKNRKRVIGVIGDSTFMHSGVTALIDARYNKGVSTVIVFDNKTTAMTGGQDHPGTGITLKKEKTHRIDYRLLAKGLGIKRIKEIDCYNLRSAERTLKKEISKEPLSLIITKNPCLLINKKKNSRIYSVDKDKCTACGECLKLECQAISLDGKKARIDPMLCSGCSLCKQICNAKAIKEQKL